MLINELILLEYDRERAKQALGPALWQAAVRDVLGLKPDTDLVQYASNPGNAYAARVKAVLDSPEQQSIMGENALTSIEEVDPSINKKYTQWMARQFINGSEPRMEDVLSTLASNVAKFNVLNVRKRLPPGENDINRYRTAGALYTAMDRYEDPDEMIGGTGKADKVYEDGDVTVIIPRNEAAACHHGRGTRWCTAVVGGRNYFDQYNADGPLYILIPKSPKRAGERYQLHFESNQYMDEDDDRVDLSMLVKDRFPGLLRFFMSKDETAKYIKDMVQFALDDVLQSLSDGIWQLTQDKVNDVLSDWEARDDDYFKWLKDEGYMDDEDEIDWDRAPGYLDYNDEARRWYHDMEEYCHPSPSAIRKFTAEMMGDGTFDEDSIYHIEDYIAGNLRWQMRRENDGGMADWIEKNIVISRTAGGPKVEIVKRNQSSGLRESSAGTRLGDLAKVSTNMPDADFWLRRSGSDNTVGEVLRSFNPDAIGIKVTATDALDPRYLSYVFRHLHGTGVFAKMASGATNLVHIKASDIANMQVSS